MMISAAAIITIHFAYAAFTKAKIITTIASIVFVQPQLHFMVHLLVF